MWLIVSSLSPHNLPLIFSCFLFISACNYYYFCNYYYSFRVFSHQRKLMVCHWSLSDSKSPRVSITLLCILAVLKNAVVWIVSTRPPTFKYSRFFNNPLVTAPKVPITIGTIVTLMFHSFFNSLARSRYYPSFHNLLVLFCGQLEQKSRQFCEFFFFRRLL